MRPSCPPPSTPIVVATHRLRPLRPPPPPWPRAPRGAPRSAVVLEREDARREERGVGGIADRHRRDRNAGRHLHDREQRVEPVERLPAHRHADDGEQCLRGSHPRQVGSAARAGDDYAQTAPGRALRVAVQQIRASDGPRRRASCATPELVRSVVAAARIVSRSETLPMMMPDVGRSCPCAPRSRAVERQSRNRRCVARRSDATPGSIRPSFLGSASTTGPERRPWRRGRRFRPRRDRRADFARIVEVEVQDVVPASFWMLEAFHPARERIDRDVPDQASSMRAGTARNGTACVRCRRCSRVAHERCQLAARSGQPDRDRAGRAVFGPISGGRESPARAGDFYTGPPPRRAPASGGRSARSCAQPSRRIYAWDLGNEFSNPVVLEPDVSHNAAAWSSALITTNKTTSGLPVTGGIHGGRL